MSDLTSDPGSAGGYDGDADDQAARTDTGGLPADGVNRDADYDNPDDDPRNPGGVAGPDTGGNPQ